MRGSGMVVQDGLLSSCCETNQVGGASQPARDAAG